MALIVTRRAMWAAPLAVVLFLIVAIAARTFWREYASFRSPPSPVDHESALKRLPSLVEVSWLSGGKRVRGWFLGGSHREAIVLMHGGGGTRSDVLPELEILSKRGFCLLAFDSPGQGESEGYVEFGEAERAAVRTAVDWLSARPEVDPARIGAFGFSSGGIPLIQEAATDSRIRAVAVAGTPGNITDFALWEYHHYGPLTQWPALLAMRMRGMQLSEQIPNEVVSHIAPRPLLVVLGDTDVVVPPWMTRSIFDAAGAPKDLLELPKTGHGEYARNHPTVYANRLASFFVTNLRGADAARPAP